MYSDKLFILLDKMKEAGYTRLAFSCYDRYIFMSKLNGIYMKGTTRYEKSYLYAHPNIVDAYGRPSIWDIVQEVGVGACGGTMSCYGLKREFAEYVGSYSYGLKRGKWRRKERKYDDIKLIGLINKVWSISNSNLSNLNLDIPLSDDYDIREVSKKKGVWDVVSCSIDEVPLYISDYKRSDIAKYRLMRGR